MPDREKVMSWLEGLSEPDWRVFHSDSEVQNIAKSALALLKEQEAKEQISDAIHEMAKQFRKPLVRCKDCKFMYEDDVFQCGIKAGYFPVHEDWFCADGERRADESTNHA